MLKVAKYSVNVHGSIFVSFFWSLLKKIGWKGSVLVVSEIFRLFVNILTPNNNYSLSVKAGVYRNLFKCNYIKIKIYFLDFSLYFRNLHELWNSLEKKMSLRGDLFLKL